MSDRINRSQAQLDWERELKQRNWDRARIKLAMFDYDPQLHGPISYAPWPTIAIGDSAERHAYERTKRLLIEQGERFSKLGAASGQSLRANMPKLVRVPCEMNSRTVFDCIATVMNVVHPSVVTQEQILRSAFVAHLPQEISRQIGTVSSCVHPERATPGLYQQTGARLLRARFDLAFGNVEDNDGITGVIEIKAGNGSFDNLKRKGEVITTEIEEVAGEMRKRKEGLSVDIDKMLDPGIPTNAFRLSWVVLGRRGLSTPETIRDHVKPIVDHCAIKRGLSLPSIKVVRERGWLLVSWPETEINLYLAWYRPSGGKPSTYETVWPN